MKIFLRLIRKSCFEIIGKANTFYVDESFVLQAFNGDSIWILFLENINPPSATTRLSTAYRVGRNYCWFPAAPFFAARDWSFVHLELKHKLYRERVGIPPDGPVDYPGFGIAFLQSYTFFELMEKKVYPVKSLSGY